MELGIALIGYAVAAVAFGVLSVLLLTTWRARVRGSLLTIASVVATAWAIALVYTTLRPDTPVSRVLLVEAVFDFTWLLLLSSLLGGAIAERSNWLVRRGGVLLGAVFLLAAIALDVFGLALRFQYQATQLLVMGSIATSLYGLVGVEQLYRNARSSQQNGLKFLCLGIAGIFGYDLYLYSNAIVDNQIRPVIWGARGFVVALCVVLIGVSIRRISSWSRGFFASRQIVFYTTSLFAAGIYLTLIGVAGYFIRTMGRGWGDVLTLVFFSAAILGFFVLILSEQLRARVRVWLIKHFFERKYDYREEWLRLIETLTATEDGLPLKKRAIKALAQVLDCPWGDLWMRREEGRFSLVSSWNASRRDAEIDADSALVTFLGEKGWVVDIEELQRNPGKYEALADAGLADLFGEARFIVPLIHEGEVLGLVTLARPRTPVQLNFEDYDLLKTAGRQIASYLKQEEAIELLAESRQFEAYNRFTAFVMHDLKNAIAQQSLVVENAKKHKHNPEFIDDAMETIRGSVERMRRVLAHLRQSTAEQSAENVDLGKLVLQAVSHCSDREPVPSTSVPDSAVLVRSNRDRLLSAVTHALRNAQDACRDAGSVTLALQTSGDQCAVEIRDTGCGMTPEFVRERLFRPFDSTKGAEGMGIGAYQVRETMRAAGGDVEVISEPGAGTTLTIKLPIARGQS